MTAIEKANEGKWEDLLEVPPPYSWRGKKQVDVANVIAGMQLRRYLDR